MDRRQFALGVSTSALAGASSRAAFAQGTAENSEARLAAYASALTFEQLPPDVVEALKRLLIDTFACAYGALGCEPAAIAEKTFRADLGGGPAVATLIGGHAPISVEGAALVNGVLVRYLDLNDIYAGEEPAHPSECVPTAIACCEEAGKSGRDLLTAMAVGYETQLALVDAMAWGTRGFHSLSAAGFVTPLIAGKAWGLTAAQMANAVGISGPKQLTLLAINAGAISMMKAFGYPSGAMDGIFAARLAKNGFTGASGALEWFIANSTGKTKEFHLELSPGKFRLLNVGLKRFPLQFELQIVAEAGVEIKKTMKATPADISEIVVETTQSAKEKTADPTRYAPKTKETADHSLPVCLAMALIDGDVTVKQFDTGRWKAPDVLALASKVRVDAVPNAPRGGGAMVRVTAGGEKIEKRIDIPDGDPRRPMAPESLAGKFNQFAAPLLGKGRAEAVLEACHNLDKLGKVSDLTKLLTAG